MNKKEIQELMLKEAKSGNLIEAGWLMHLRRVMPEETSKHVERCVRHAFFTGAGHVLETFLQGIEEAEVVEDLEVLLVTMKVEMKRFSEANQEYIMSIIQGDSRH